MNPPEENDPRDERSENEHVNQSDDNAEADAMVELEEGDEGPEGCDEGGDEEDEDLGGGGLVGLGVLVDEPGEDAPDGDEGEDLEGADEGEEEFADRHCVSWGVGAMVEYSWVLEWLGDGIM